MGGIKISVTSELTIRPKATPMMRPTARSTTLPRMRKALNACHMDVPPVGACPKDGPCALRGPADQGTWDPQASIHAWTRATSGAGVSWTGPAHVSRFRKYQAGAGLDWGSRTSPCRSQQTRSFAMGLMAFDVGVHRGAHGA